MSEPSLDDVARSFFEKGAAAMLLDICLFVAEEIVELPVGADAAKEAISQLMARAKLIGNVSAPGWTL